MNSGLRARREPYPGRVHPALPAVAHRGPIPRGPGARHQGRHRRQRRRRAGPTRLPGEDKVHITYFGGKFKLTINVQLAADPVQPGGEPDHVDGGLPGLGRRPQSRLRWSQSRHGGVRQDQGEWA